MRIKIHLHNIILLKVVVIRISVSFKRLFEDNEEEDLDDTSVYTIIKKCNRITSYFHKSGVATKELRSEMTLREQGPMKLVQSVYTRWNSTYDMLASIHNAIDAIVTVLAKTDCRIPSLTFTERKAIPEILDTLKPFVNATRTLSGDTYATNSLIIPLTKSILNELEEVKIRITVQAVHSFRNKLEKLTKERMLQYETRTVSA